MENSKTYVVASERSAGEPEKTTCIYVFTSKRKAKSYLRMIYRDSINPSSLGNGDPTFISTLHNKGRSIIYCSPIQRKIVPVYRMRIVDMSDEEVNRRYPNVPRVDMEKYELEKRKNELTWLYGAKVKDVIAALQMFPPDAKVLIQTRKIAYSNDVHVYQTEDGDVTIEDAIC